jgi:excisionase family DNA binding protein
VPAHAKLKQAAADGSPLTSSEAASLTGYSRDHVGLLLRRGVLSGRKFGRDWVVDSRSLLAYVEGSPKPGRKST